MIELYTDGSCSGNGKDENHGGYAVVLVKNDEVFKTYVRSEENTTNNRMEFKAVILAIEIAKILNAKDTQEIKIYTDSSYVHQIINSWMRNWEKKGWKKGDGKEPENIDLVKRVFELMEFERAIKVEKIKGHAGHEFNELADDLAKQGTEMSKEEING